ncbi:YggS family pyridoxal phosphate-dependent enzyme [Jatrophihabitans telluris]|uniref:Pyridoxal phosphate homeostasis protein n=1 Tax=Jatrophihabitans telluris TaxID=2038343 RepID=A0ABY4QU54_9ACTN|nr:YggS family pyridoxal phosphate-dependent enzyme [Jatrophihabitans telluris]UQX87184.1 YggS family pyridoxal phosphate-dependent enzyme [Jatrophihabitans telluris]
MSAPDRAAELRANLRAVRLRIATAAERAGRDPNTITLIAVTKFFPVADVLALAEAGVTDFGESRDQDASTKAAEFADLSPSPVSWHFVGRLQTNKARSVASYADVVHSVDRAALVDALANGVRAADRAPLAVLLQVSLDVNDVNTIAGPSGASERGGVRPGDLLALADQVASRPELVVAGVMSVPPQDRDPADAFSELLQLSAALRAQHGGATMISAGMSADLDSAIEHGATHVRIGTALLGPRKPTIG